MESIRLGVLPRCDLGDGRKCPVVQELPPHILNVVPKDTTFLLVDQVITLLVSIQGFPRLQPPVSIDQRHVVLKLLRTVG